MTGSDQCKAAKGSEYLRELAAHRGHPEAPLVLISWVTWSSTGQAEGGRRLSTPTCVHPQVYYRTAVFPHGWVLGVGYVHWFPVNPLGAQSLLVSCAGLPIRDP